MISHFYGSARQEHKWLHLQRRLSIPLCIHWWCHSHVVCISKGCTHGQGEPSWSQLFEWVQSSLMQDWKLDLFGMNWKDAYTPSLWAKVSTFLVQPVCRNPAMEPTTQWLPHSWCTRLTWLYSYLLGATSMLAKCMQISVGPSCHGQSRWAHSFIFWV